MTVARRREKVPAIMINVIFSDKGYRPEEIRDLTVGESLWVVAMFQAVGGGAAFGVLLWERHVIWGAITHVVSRFVA